MPYPLTGTRRTNRAHKGLRSKGKRFREDGPATNLGGPVLQAFPVFGASLHTEGAKKNVYMF